MIEKRGSCVYKRASKEDRFVPKIMHSYFNETSAVDNKMMFLVVYLSYENLMFFSIPVRYFEEVEGKFTAFLSWIRSRLWPDSSITIYT